eukprot:323760-Pelagomonas_calceolata.AAC.2
MYAVKRSLHQIRNGQLGKERKTTGRGNSPNINQGGGDTLAQKIRKSTPQSRNRRVLWGPGGFLEAPGSRT